MSQETMKVWQFSDFGKQFLQLREVPVPKPGPHEVLVRVAAVSLNYRDKLVLEGKFGTDLPLPFVPASDAAGEIVAIGEGVTRCKTGERVMAHFYPKWIKGEIRTEEESFNLGAPLPGVLAEYILLHEEGVVKTPAYLSDPEASTLPIAAVTAWSALFEKCQIQPGQTVLLQGTGGVSIFALQLAVAAGAKVIITSSSDEKLARAKELGAHAGVNYAREQDWDQAVLTLTNGVGVDGVVEVTGGESVRRSANALARGGRIALVGFLQDRMLTIDGRSFMLKLATITSVGVGSRSSFEMLNRALETARIRPVIDQVFSFAEVPQAFERLDRGPFGKIVVQVAN